MQTNDFSVWWPRAAALILAGLASASSVFWVLKTSGKQVDLNLPAVATNGAMSMDPVAVSRALGGASPSLASTVPTASLASRFSIAGVLADTHAGGVALLSVDGALPKPYRVGAKVAEGLWLKSVTGRVAEIAPGVGLPTALTLELPPLKR